MTRASKIVFGSLAFIIVGVISYYAFQVLSVFAALGGFERSSKAALVENYEDRESEIKALKKYFNGIVPEGYEVYIEYNDEDQIDLVVIEKPGHRNASRAILFEQWSINPYDYKEGSLTVFDNLAPAPKTKSLDVVKETLGWNDDTFREIERYLNKANCISIGNGEPATIGFARSGMGKYFYKGFNNEIPDNLTDQWNDGCTYILHSKSLVLEYAGGVSGPQCFPDK